MFCSVSPVEADYFMMSSACFIGLGKAVYFMLLSASGGLTTALKFPVVVDFHSELHLHVSEWETETESCDPWSSAEIMVLSKQHWVPSPWVQEWSFCDVFSRSLGLQSKDH